jgi:hypothetical protein
VELVTNVVVEVVINVVVKVVTNVVVKVVTNVVEDAASVSMASFSAFHRRIFRKYLRQL